MNLTHYRYTEGEFKELLKSMTLLVDTREQENGHILAWLDKQKVPHISRKLDFGDYSFYLPANPEMGIARDLYFNNSIAIERKNSLDELAGNIADGRTAFENELIRAKGAGARLFLMVENANYADIVKHNYRAQYDPKAFVATLKTFEHRYGLDINFVHGSCSADFIFRTLYYYLREHLK